MDVSMTMSGGDKKGQDQESELSGMSGGYRKGERRWTDNQTSIIGGESVNINTKENTHLKGAIIAQINEDNSDGGNLELNTGSLTVEELHDSDVARQQSGGYSSGGNSTSVQYSDAGHVRGQTVHATIGKGAIHLQDGEAEEPGDLNRDINKATTLTANRKTGGFNVVLM